MDEIEEVIKIDNKYVTAVIKTKNPEHCFKIAVAIVKICQEIRLEEGKEK